uniref:glucuronosyltransferase n=1 Tax=Globodera rostochiensis TaxID=31243 RepID=A0A914HX86_GLORO
MSGGLPTFLLLFLFLFCQQCQCANVLFTVFHDRGSHFGSMLPLMERLARHGHAVSVLDTIHRSDKSPLIRHIRATLPHSETENEAERLAFAEFFWNQTDSSVTLPEFYNQADGHLATLMLNHSAKMVDLFNEDWDLIVIDDLMWPFGYFVATFKQRFWHSARTGTRPRVIVYGTAAQTLVSAESVRATSWCHSTIWLPNFSIFGRNWISRVPFCPFMPTDSQNVFRPALFAHRLFAFYENFAEIVLLNWITESYMMPNIANFGVPNFSWAELFRHTAYEFSDFIDRMGWPLAHGPEMLNVGSHCKSAGPLPSKFAQLIEEPPHYRGTILVAFGSYPDWELAPARILNGIFGALNALSDYRIIFAYDGPPTIGALKMGTHIKLFPWVPQMEILANPKTLLFITHGGLKSVREGLCAGVPMIVLPLFAEQAHQAHLLLAMGIAPVVNKYSLTEQSVLQTIQAVVSDPKSVLRSRKFRDIFTDRIIPPLDEALFRVERLVKGNNWPQIEQIQRNVLRRKGADFGWTEFAHFDLAIFILTIILTAAKF